MKKVCLDLTESRGLGDTICATPIVRKLYETYGYKIAVITQHPEVFQRNPYVSELYFPDTTDFNVIIEKYTVFNSFHKPNHEDCRGVVPHHNVMDLRQFHATNLGFMLSDYEMSMDYVPREFEPIEGLPERFVLIHPVTTWASRTWSEQRWLTLTTLLNESGIAVVSVGKDSSEVGYSNVQKPVFNFPISLGLNLLNQTDISQTWWLMNKSMCFVTMDSGLLHLAGTTDSHILQLGSSVKPDFRAPYRNNTQSYKYDYVSGSCNIFCASDLKYAVKEWGTINSVPSLVNCLEKKPTFECHPNVIDVYNKIMKITENYAI